MPNQKPTPNQKPITNPELVEALKALHQENTPQNQGKVLGLVVERAVFLTPAVVTPAPQRLRPEAGHHPVPAHHHQGRPPLLPRLHRRGGAAEVRRSEAGAVGGAPL